MGNISVENKKKDKTIMNIANQTFWESLKNDVIKEFGEEIYDTFFMNSKFDSLDNDKYSVVVKNQSVRVVFNDHFKLKIENIIFNKSKQKVNFEPFCIEGESPEKIKALRQQSWYEDYKPLKNYLFDNFVPGDSNLKALKSAQLMTSNPSLNINPLFIYGDSGLGKTHLLNAIGNDFLKQNPNLKVVYISAYDFINGYISALGHINWRNQSSLNDFTTNFLEADVLLLDDVQSFNSKVETSETFFNIFNHLVNHNKKIIIAADKAPHQLKGIEERLITRFNQGLSVPVLKPGNALAKAFLNKRLEICFKDSPELIITDEVIDVFATNFGTDFRTLTEVINSLSLQVTIFPTQKIDLDYIKEHLNDKIQNKTKKSSRDILEYVSEYFQISDYNLITGSGRKKELVLARNCAVWLIRTYTPHNSYKQIGNIFNGRDHTTIMHSYKKIKKELENNKEMKKIISDIEKKAMLKT